MAVAATFDELLSRCRRNAVHLEMRDGYAVTHPGFVAWQAGRRLEPADRASWWRPWLERMAALTARGVTVRRARVISEPVTMYIRWEHEESFTNIAAGEQIRWLPRAQASDIALPGNDFWLFDDRVAVFNLFAGDGTKTGEQVCEEPAVVTLCATSFETVWQRATPHELYRPR